LSCIQDLFLPMSIKFHLVSLYIESSCVSIASHLKHFSVIQFDIFFDLDIRINRNEDQDGKPRFRIELPCIRLCYMAFAFDPSPLQDFCIADLTGSGCGPTITFLALFCTIDFSYCLLSYTKCLLYFFFGIRIFNKFAQSFQNY
jgi:hypothetical protein